MLTENELLDLCVKYREHRLTEAEYRILQSWVNECEENHRLFANYVHLYKAELRVEASDAAHPSKAWIAILQKRKRRRLRFAVYRTMAAACFLAFVIALSFYFRADEPMELLNIPATLAETFPDIPQNKVTLTLSSGQQVVLDKDSLQLVSDKGTVVAQGTNTSLNYATTASQATHSQYNTLSEIGRAHV